MPGNLTAKFKLLRTACKPLELSHAPNTRPESLWAQVRPGMHDSASAYRDARHLFP